VRPAGFGESDRSVARRRVAALLAAEGLALAASPTFAVMALLTSVGSGHTDIVCSAGHGSWIGGMAPMYWLMCVFHAPPWLRLISGSGKRRAAIRD
jgi:hypothetical protein